MNIRDESQLEKAKLEDLLVELLYYRYENLVFHGCTAIWRCYSGNRFCRDIDFYLSARTNEEKRRLFKDMENFLKGFGFKIKEKVYGASTNTMHFLIEASAKMKIDINFAKKKGTPIEYKKVDDSKLIVLSLTPLNLLEEKIDTYNDKLSGTSVYSHPEIQDLYDIYYLVSLIKQPGNATIKRLSSLVQSIELKSPSNVRSLGHLILSGLPPSFDLMISKLKEWINDNS